MGEQKRVLTRTAVRSNLQPGRSELDRAYTSSDATGPNGKMKALELRAYFLHNLCMTYVACSVPAFCHASGIILYTTP